MRYLCLDQTFCWGFCYTRKHATINENRWKSMKIDNLRNIFCDYRLANINRYQLTNAIDWYRLIDWISDDRSGIRSCCFRFFRSMAHGQRMRLPSGIPAGTKKPKTTRSNNAVTKYFPCIKANRSKLAKVTSQKSNLAPLLVFCSLCLKTIKGTVISPIVVILDLDTLRGTKPQILPPKRYDDHPRHFYMRVLPRAFHIF